MIEYFRLNDSGSQRLLVLEATETQHEVTLCPVTEGMGQHRSERRVGNLALEVKHTKRDQSLISSLDGMVLHARLLEEFERRGFTGYRLRPATVRFRDGYLSQDYSELVVTGWAGVAPPESGVELIEACGGCGYKKYSTLKHPESLIDWTQWTGEDFFFVWPLPKFTLITKRVADALEELKVRSYRLESMLKPQSLSFSMGWGYSVGALSHFLPEDLANRYGKPLGLECEPGCWPSVEPRASENEVPSEAPSFCGMGSSEPDLRGLSTRIRSGKGPDRQAAIRSLFRLAEGDGARPFDVSQECLELLERGELKPEEVAPYAPALLAIWDAVHAELRPRQQESASTEWMFDDEYHEARALGEVVLDVLGYIPGEEARRSLHGAVRLIDPRLKTFAILSLLRHGESVDPAEIERAACSLEMRMIFWRQLKKMGRQSLMPEVWTDPVHLAASDLSHWASHPNELGVAPEEIEPMMVFHLESDEGDQGDVYLFRFREYAKPWEPGDGWMAGIAGPISDGKSQDSPWSAFDKWDSMSPEEHFDKLYYRGSACAAG